MDQNLLFPFWVWFSHTTQFGLPLYRQLITDVISDCETVLWLQRGAFINMHNHCFYCILHTEHNWTWSWGEIKLFFKTHILISDCLTLSLLFRTSQRHMLNNMCWCDNFLFVFYFLQYVAEKEAGNCLDNNTERVTKGKILGFYFILFFYKMTRNRRPLLDSGDM